MTRGVAPGCKRCHVDLPSDLYEKAKAMASEPPAISFAEWVRRLIAWKAGYTLPPASERRAKRLRLTGEPKQRTGPKPRACDE